MDVQNELEKIADSKPNDVFKLLFDKDCDIDHLDLNRVAEVKLTLGKSIEVKFIDPLKPIDRIDRRDTTTTVGFYQALLDSQNDEIEPEECYND